MSRPSLSVAMCTFNGAHYLMEQLESIRFQSYLPDELVISDDASSDTTIGILRNFASKCPFQIRIIENEKRVGSTKNFENAVRQCSGDIVVLADQDDIWEREKLRKVMEIMQKYPDAAYVFSDGEIIDKNGRSLGIRLWDIHVSTAYLRDGWRRIDQLPVLLRENVVTGSTMAFRACYNNIFLPIPSSWVHDYWIALLGSAYSYGVAIAEPLIRYRHHSGQQIGIRKPPIFEMIKDSLLNEKKDYEKRLHMFEELLNRSKMAGCPSENIHLIKEKVTHLSKREICATLKGARKVCFVLLEVQTGRYKRFSGSWKSILRDLCPDLVRRYAIRILSKL